MLGYWIDELARRAARLRVGDVRPNSDVVKVNLGSGLHVAPGWINVDGSIHSMFARAPRSVLSLLYRHANSIKQDFTELEYLHRLRDHRFVFAPLEGRLPFADASADYLYCSHVLEHFFLEDARTFVSETHRILKPGGIFRICVPDLDHALAFFGAGQMEAALAYFFTESRTGYYRQHRYMYNFALLANLLRQQGFADITRCSYQHGRVPDLEKLDNRPEETLYVEAVKARLG